MTIGSKLQKYRVQKNYTTLQVAQKLRISEEEYSKYENDEENPDLDFLKKISEIFGINIFDLFGAESSINFYNSTIEATNLINQNSVINQHLPEKVFSLFEDRISDLKSQIEILKKNNYQ